MLTHFHCHVKLNSNFPVTVYFLLSAEVFWIFFPSSFSCFTQCFCRFPSPYLLQSECKHSSRENGCVNRCGVPWCSESSLLISEKLFLKTYFAHLEFNSVDSHKKSMFLCFHHLLELPKVFFGTIASIMRLL